MTEQAKYEVIAVLDLTRSRYFKALPAFLQESIMQSGIDFETEDELMKFAAAMQNASE